MSFLIPTDWLRKPEQWDITPLDVFYNAERLGIDPASIVALWPFWEGAGTVVHDCVGKYNLSVTNTPDWVGDGLDTYPAYLSNSASTVFQSEIFTALVCVDIGQANTGKSGGFFTSGGTATSGSWGICRSYTGSKQIFGHFETSNGSAVNINTIVNSGEKVVAACVNDGLTYTAYAAGTLATGSANGIYTGSWGIYIGNWGGDTGRWEDGIISLAAYLTQALTVDQLNTLNDDPYALIRPVARPFVFDLAAGTSYPLSGQVAALASLTGVAALAAGMAGSAQALASVAAQARSAAALTGQAQAAAAVSAAAKLGEALAGTAQALAVLTGDLAESSVAALAGVVQALATVSGNARARSALAGTSAGALTATAEAAMRAALAGDAAGLAQILDAVCQARARLQGAVQAAGEAGLDARLAVPLAGTIDALGQAAGTLVELGESLGLLTDPRLRDVTRRWHLHLARRWTLRET